MQYVKNTIPGILADLISPYYCCACGEIGGALCDSCKNDIISESFNHCLVCLEPTLNDRGLCRRHTRFARGVSVVGWRRDSLEQLVGVSKFQSQRAGCQIQAELIERLLPRFAGAVTVVPIPTSRAHIRERGYGHIERAARRIAALRDYDYTSLLRRQTTSVQHTADRTLRERQARTAFRLRGTIDPERTYLLVDDVYTTGATLRAALRLLRQAGARELWCAVTSRQPLD